MDREKFTQEVLKSENTMYHIAKGMLKSESDCEDVVSEAVLKAYTKIHTLKEEKNVIKSCVNIKELFR